MGKGEKMEKIKVRIVDDSPTSIRQGKEGLEKTGKYTVEELLITDPKKFLDVNKMTLEKVAQGIDVLLIDKDIGEGINSTPIICLIRKHFPKLPIIRWTAGYDATQHMLDLNVTCIDKKDIGKLSKVFGKAYEQQVILSDLVLSNQKEIYWKARAEIQKPKIIASQRQQIADISKLKERDIVTNTSDTSHPFGITGNPAGTMMHELGHCFCDGLLTVKDIKPFLSDLQRVVERVEERKEEIDNFSKERFQSCADFIKIGDLTKLGDLGDY